MLFTAESVPTTVLATAGVCEDKVIASRAASGCPRMRRTPAVVHVTVVLPYMAMRAADVHRSVLVTVLIHQDLN